MLIYTLDWTVKCPQKFEIKIEFISRADWIHNKHLNINFMQFKMTDICA